MQDEKKLEIILERFYNRYNQFNSKVLKTLGEAIKKFDGLTPSEAHKLAQTLKYNTDIDKILNELSKISGKSVQEVNELLDAIAKENVEFSETYYKAKNKDFVSYEKNKQLQRYVETIKKETNETFKNLSKPSMVGFSWKDSKGNIVYKPFKTAYRDLIDEAVFNVSTGTIDYQSAMRNTLKKLADSGVKIHENNVNYKSGYNRRIDSSVRQNILTGIRKINIGVQKQVGEEFGADGLEVSAHSPCAEDHLEINGKQYKAKSGENLDDLLDRINSHLIRPIGELNCTHFVFSIIYGVNLPSHTDEQLREMREDSLKKVEYEGKKYTKYEATQIQRRLETEIRRQKDRQIIAKASNDKDGIWQAQSKITQLTEKYKDFSDKVGLDTYKNRLYVSQYHRVNVKNLK